MTLTSFPRSATECIARGIMPQLDEADLNAFLIYLSQQDIPFRKIALDPRSVRGRQKVNRDKIRHMTDEVIRKPILVSVEPLILDGNHRWFYADYHRAPAIPSWQIERDFMSSLDLLCAFPKTYYYDAAPQPERN